MTKRTLLAIVSSAAVLGGSIFLANEFSRQARYFVISKIDSVLTSRNSSVAMKMHETMELQVNVLKNFQTLFNESPYMVRDIFDLSAAVPKKLYPGVIAVGYAPRVSRRERWSFSEYVKMEGFDRYRIHPTGVREFYYPVQYVVPYFGNRSFHGYDLASNAPLLQVIENAVVQDTILLSPLTVIDSLGSKELFVIAPVYKLDTIRRQVIKGPVRGICFVRIDPQVFVREALRTTVDASASFIRVYASEYEDRSQIIFDGLPATGSVTFDHKTWLRIGGQTWMFHFSANSRSQGVRNLELPQEVTILGMVVAGIIAILVFFAVYRPKRSKTP